MRDQRQGSPVPGFDLVLADPPWRYSFSKSSTRKIENHYPTMKLDEVKSLGSRIPLASNAVLYLWATAPKLLEALEVMEAWGFEYKTHAVWDKGVIGMGYWFRGQHELVLVGTKGKFSPPEPPTRVSSIFRSRRTKHSAKPEVLNEWIDHAFPKANKLEMFARGKRKGWSVWGNEVESDLDL